MGSSAEEEVGPDRGGFECREVWENHWATAHREVGMVACLFFYPVLMSVFVVVVVGSPDGLGMSVLSGGLLAVCSVVVVGCVPCRGWLRGRVGSLSVSASLRNGGCGGVDDVLSSSIVLLWILCP